MAKNRAAEKAAEQILYGQFEVKEKKTPFLENRTHAIVLTVVAILLGTVIGCHRSVAAQGREVTEKFSTGIQYSGYSINSDLEDRMDYAQQLAKIAQRYDLAEQAKAVSDAVSTLYTAGHGHACYIANRELTDVVELLNGSLVNASLSSQDEQYRLEAYRNFVSCNDTISREAALYNELVYEFNHEILDAFPTGTLAKLTGVGELEAFE
ncbi:MAG: hypothetical protein E7449_03655 [Ruminococcaceae bacterium]|nr:hypothetical protein [Oscillospiraceae bacterium]